MFFLSFSLFLNVEILISSNLLSFNTERILCQ